MRNIAMHEPRLTRNGPHHDNGAASVPMLVSLGAIIIGVVAGVFIGWGTRKPWLGIVLGVVAAVLVEAIGAGFHFSSDVTRYKKIRSM